MDAANTYDRYEKKNITVRFSGVAQGFTKLTSIEYKFVPKGVNNKTIAYKTGSSYTVKNGNCGRFYVRYNTPLGSTEIKLPGFTVDTKAPTSVKIKGISQESKHCQHLQRILTVNGSRNLSNLHLVLIMEPVENP